MSSDPDCTVCEGAGWDWRRAADEDLQVDDPVDYYQCPCVKMMRLRAAIESLLFDIDGDHQPEWASAEDKAAGKKPWVCTMCGTTDGGWPCTHRVALDELKGALGG